MKSNIYAVSGNKKIGHRIIIPAEAYRKAGYPDSYHVEQRGDEGILICRPIRKVDLKSGSD
jgi:hypothetical protein